MVQWWNVAMVHWRIGALANWSSVAMVHWCGGGEVVIRWQLVLNLTDFEMENICFGQNPKRLSFGYLGGYLSIAFK